MSRNRNRRIRIVAAAVMGGLLAVSVSSVSAHASQLRTTAPPPTGPCAISRVSGEAIEEFSIRIITCAATRWPVEGGAEKAICIARRESGLIPTASSSTGMYVGLFQHSAADWPRRYDEWTRPSWRLKENPYNGRSNAIVTIRMANAEGWDPWAGAGC